jgi:hypothetical protein
MKRDMDLIREILQAVEASPTGTVKYPFALPDRDEAAVYYHVYLLCNAGLLDGMNISRVDSDGGPAWAPSNLTWAGHEFLDASRDPGRWKQAMHLTKAAGDVAFPILVKVLADLALKHLHVA